MRKKICIVSTGIDGPSPPDGTAVMTGLIARSLVADKNDVCVLIPNCSQSDFPMTYWIEKARTLGFKLQMLGFDVNHHALSFFVFDFLRTRDYDVILFLDRQALAYWSMRAQRQGVAFQKTALTLLACDPTSLFQQETLVRPDTPTDLPKQEMERWLLIEADNLFVVHLSMIKLLSQLGRKKPFIVIKPPVAPSLRAAFETGVRAREQRSVFIGLGLADEQWGLSLMAQGSIGKNRHPFTFIGRSGRCITQLPGFAHLMKTYTDQPDHLELRFAETLEEICEELGRTNGSVVIRDDAPAAEPFRALAETFHFSIVNLAGDPLVSEPPLETAPFNSAFMALYYEPPKPAVIDRTPLVSVCICHFKRPRLLEQAIESVRRQTHSRMELVLYDDASPDSETPAYLESLQSEFNRRDWRILRGDTEVWAAAGRNAAAAAARGDYLLIMDDDNCARPQETEVLLSVAQRTGSEALSALARLFEGQDYPDQSIEATNTFFFPIGHGRATGAQLNTFGDANWMFSRRAFDAVGGFVDYPSVGCEDYEILARLYLRGFWLEFVPLVLYDYRFSEHNMAQGISNERAYYSHRRINDVFAETSRLRRCEMDALSNIHNSDTQIKGHSYWTRTGRTAVDQSNDNNLCRSPELIAARLDVALRASGSSITVQKP